MKTATRYPDELRPFASLVAKAQANLLPRRTLTISYGGKRAFVTNAVNTTIRNAVASAQAADSPGVWRGLASALQDIDDALNGRQRTQPSIRELQQKVRNRHAKDGQ